MTVITKKPTPTAENIMRHVVEAVAEVQCKTVAQIRSDMMGNGGDSNLPVKVAMAVVAIVEEKLEAGELLSPLDFATNTTNGIAEGNLKKFSPNGCMDPAESASIKGIAVKIMSKLGIANFPSLAAVA